MTRLDSSRWRVLATQWFLPAAVLLTAAPVAASLTGKWQFTLAPPLAPTPQFVDIAQSGTAATFTWSTLSFTGTASGGILNAQAPASPPVTDCPTAMHAIVSPDETVMELSFLDVVTPCNYADTYLLTARRCGCFDGNTTDGDGCDASCQIEECYTCTGDPSMCAPSGEGAACDDGMICTAGETCSSGACVGGSPVIPCIDLTGAWLLHSVVPDFLDEAFYQVYYRQIGTFLEESSSPSGAANAAGPIDPATGVYRLEKVRGDYFSDWLCQDDYINGQSSDGATLDATGVNFIRTPTECSGFTVLVAGSRCGGGTLDAGEECDDGNATAGDGCSATCAVEACYQCTGEPSVCSPVDGTPCDDGDPCTNGDVCAAGTCAPGAPVICAPCLNCGPSGTCEAAPVAGCRQSTVPDAALLVVKNRERDAGDHVTWKWLRGAATSLEDLGDPVGSDGYALCLYDESGASPALLFRAAAPAGDPWRSSGDRGFSYDDKGAASDGVRSLDLRSGGDGNARAILKAQGPMLSNRPFGLPSPALPLPLRAQLRGENGACFESYFTAAGVSHNEPGGTRFKARGSASP